MPEKKEEAKKTLGTEEWEAERIRLTEELQVAKQALWDHSHPVIESESEKVHAEYRAQQIGESKKAAAKSAPGSWGTEKKAEKDENTQRN